jgi:hypothetical protein
VWAEHPIALWVGITWAALGLVTVCGIELADRSYGRRGPLSQAKLLSSIGYSGALIVGAPFLLLLSVGVCCQMLWQGRIPTTNRIWWPARAAKLDPARPRRETILVQMIELRRRKDPRLGRAKPADRWPMFQLRETPEATILSTMEDFRWLKDAGLDDQSALRRMETLTSGNASPLLGSGFTLRGLIAISLKTVDPSYLALGDEILVRQLEIADKWVQDQIQWTKSQPAFPPIEWLKKRVTEQEIDSGQAGRILASVPKHTDWLHVRARLVAGDEIWEFDSPREDWERLMGWRGIALIRDGRPIAHIVVVMN